MENGHEDDVPMSYGETQSQQTQSQMTQSQPISQLTQEEIQRWGILEPDEKIKDKGFQLLNLVNEAYTAGKTEDNDICFTAENVQDRKEKPTVPISSISRLHFTIKKEVCTAKGDYVVILMDHSRNGTFVNKRIVGKDKKIVLENNDVIAVGKAHFAETIVEDEGGMGDGLCPLTMKFFSLKFQDRGTDYAVVFKITIFKMAGCTDALPAPLPAELNSQYLILRRLGSGAAGVVDLAYSKGSFSAFAIKAINKTRMSVYGPRNPLNDPKKIQNEVNILRQLKHPCIIKMESIIDTPRNVFIVLELMEGGELFDRISAASGLPEKVSKFMFWQICHAVHYLHRHGITHRDLKPENILLSSNDEYPLVKVSDFGMSKLVDTESMMKTYCGTPLYVAPEILETKGRGVYTTQIDVWSLGVILYVMLSGWVPFNSHNEDVPLDEQIMKGMYGFPVQKFARVSDDAKCLIKSMLTVSPQRRLTISQVLRHTWLLKDEDIKNAVTLIMGGTITNENVPPNGALTNGARTNGGHVFEMPGFKPKRARIN